MGDIIPPDTYYHQIVVESDLRDGCATQIYTPPCTRCYIVVDYDLSVIHIITHCQHIVIGLNAGLCSTE